MTRRITPWMWTTVFVLLAACGTGGVDDAGVDGLDDGGEPQAITLHPTRVIVWPAPGEDVAAIAQDAGAVLVNEVPGKDVYVIRFNNEDAAEDFVDDLQSDARILDAERDIIVNAPEGGGATLPLGEIFDFSVVQDQPELTRIGAAVARTRATGNGTRVAVIDSGVVSTHVLLAGHVEPGGFDYVDGDNDPTDVPNGQDDDGDGHIDEGFGHGTFVSSLVLAVAPDVSIVPYRVLNSDSTGLASHVAAAIHAATDAGVHVINLSLGMEHRSLLVGEAMDYARSQGVLVVASAGNTEAEEVTYPATISIALSVTAVDPGDLKPQFASYGGDVDVCAPGFVLFGAYPVADDAACQWSGTSFSAALVTGAYALVRELNPGWGQGQIVQWIQNTSDDVVDLLNPLYAGKMGEGRLDLDAVTMPAGP